MAVVVERTFTIEPGPATVLSYLEDFSNAEEWDPGTVRCTRRDSGPVQVGSSWNNTSKFAGNTTELLYTLESRTDEQLVFVGQNQRATSTDTITVSPSARRVPAAGSTTAPSSSCKGSCGSSPRSSGSSSSASPTVRVTRCSRSSTASSPAEPRDVPPGRE